MSTDADRIAAAGRTVTFADGEHTLSFGFLAMRWVEDELGGLLGMIRDFGVADENEDEDTAKERRDHVVSARYTTVAKTLACGIAHEFVTTSKNGRVVLPLFEDVHNFVLSKAEPSRVNEYATAAFGAYWEAIPAPEAEETPDPTPDAPPPPPTNGSHSSASPGAVSTTSPLSDMVVVTSTSG